MFAHALSTCKAAMHESVNVILKGTLYSMFVFDSQKDQNQKNLKHPDDYSNIGFGTLNLNQKKKFYYKPFTPYHQYTNSPHCSLYIS